MNISRCPSCLKSGYSGFCLSCRKRLFAGRNVDPILPFSRPEYNHHRLAHATRLSISGVQSKYSLTFIGPQLTLTEEGGTHILKPFVPVEFDNMEAMPANEHITMQLASQIFSITTAPNCLIFFDGEETPAYLTKRFDVLPGGGRLPQEDFAQIAGMSEDTHGASYKYNYSYEHIAALLKKHVGAYAVEVEKLFRLIIFNYLVHNGDAHLKNFSLLRDPSLGTYVLTPAYDLLNTRMHLPHESALALDLFDGDFETESFAVNGFFAREDFREFGSRIGMRPQRIERFLNEFVDKTDLVEELVDRSYLDDEGKKRYIAMVRERAGALGYSYHTRARQ